MNLKATIEQAKSLNNGELNSLIVKFNKARADKRPFNKIIGRIQNKINLILKEKRDNEKH